MRPVPEAPRNAKVSKGNSLRGDAIIPNFKFKKKNFSFPEAQAPLAVRDTTTQSRQLWKVVSSDGHGKS